MPLFDYWPYTDLSKLNLDYVLSQIDSVKEIKAEIEAKLAELDQYTQAFNDLSAKYDRLEGDFIAFKNDVNTQFTAGMNSLNYRFNELSANINAQYASFTQNVNALIQALHTEVSDLDTQLQQVITGLQDAIILFNPLTGETNSLQQIIYYLSSLHMGDALTAAEYDALDLTAAAYDAYNLTAYQYDSEGRTLLV